MKLSSKVSVWKRTSICFPELGLFEVGYLWISKHLSMEQPLTFQWLQYNVIFVWYQNWKDVLDISCQKFCKAYCKNIYDQK